MTADGFWARVVGPSCGLGLWARVVGLGCGLGLWAWVVEPSCGPELWAWVVEPSCGLVCGVREPSSCRARRKPCRVTWVKALGPQKAASPETRWHKKTGSLRWAAGSLRHRRSSLGWGWCYLERWRAPSAGAACARGHPKPNQRRAQQVDSGRHRHRGYVHAQAHILLTDVGDLGRIACHRSIHD